MRILQINSVCGVGSTGRIAADIHGILRGYGHDSHIAYGRSTARGCETAIRLGSKFDTYVHAMKTRLFDKHGYGSYRATEEFIRQVELLDPDVVHLHNIHGYYINIELLFRYLKATGKPVIWTFHDCWPFTGHCAYFAYAGCEKWRNGCGRCPQIRSYPSSILIDNSAQNFVRKRELFSSVKDLTIVTPSRWLASLVQESFFGERPVVVINNGIDLAMFKPRESNYRQRHNLENKFVILGVASPWSRRKGYDYFVALSQRLQDDEVIVLVGLEKNQIKSLPQSVIGVARTNSVDELADIYSAADAFVNPTLEDNFPTTNLEALACGTPVITFDTGGSGESVDSGCGFVVKQGDVNGLRCSIEKVKRRGKSCYSEHSRERAVMFYDMDARFREYLDLYRAASARAAGTKGTWESM